MASRGATPLLVAEGNRIVGIVVLEDILKPGIRELPLTFPVTTELPRDEAPYCDAVRAFCATGFEGTRHAARVAKIVALETAGR